MVEEAAEVVTGGAVPGEIAPGETVPGEIAPGETAPGETVPGETVPGDIVPKALRVWFVIHFWADMSFALPLFVAPTAMLAMLGWQTVDPITARLVAAALFGIGIESLLGRHQDAAGFLPMLNLKVIWSLTASLGIAWSIAEGAQDRPLFAWVVLVTFVAFHAVWVYWRLRLGRLMAGR